MGKHTDNTYSVLTATAEIIGTNIILRSFNNCPAVSRKGQTVCTIKHNGNDKHGGFSTVTDQFRTWGGHRA